MGICYHPVRFCGIVREENQIWITLPSWTRTRIKQEMHHIGTTSWSIVGGGGGDYCLWRIWDTACSWLIIMGDCEKRNQYLRDRLVTREKIKKLRVTKETVDSIESSGPVKFYRLNGIIYVRSVTIIIYDIWYNNATIIIYNIMMW